MEWRDLEHEESRRHAIAISVAVTNCGIPFGI
jgi:hypothetical protein